MKISNNEKSRGVRINNISYCYTKAPIICRDSKTGRNLHRDMRGKWFLHAPDMTGVKSITPLTIEEAKKIVARDGTAEQYQKIFMVPSGMQKCIKFEGRDVVCLEALCEIYKTSGNDLIRRLIRAEYRRCQKRAAEEKRQLRIRLNKMDKPLMAEDEPL